jgi:3',5'-cyclic AMP phosphodiesterase CpdA
MMGIPRPPRSSLAVGSSSGSPARNKARRRQVVLGQEGRVLLLQHAHGGGRAEHHRDLVLLDQAPPDAGVRPGRQALVHDGGHAGDQRAVDDVAVAHHPADVAGGEVGLAGLAAEDVLHAGGQRHRIAAGVALHALGLAGGAAGVERVAGVVASSQVAGHHGVEVLARAGGVVLVAAGHGPTAPGRGRPSAPWPACGWPA